MCLQITPKRVEDVCDAQALLITFITHVSHTSVCTAAYLQKHNTFCEKNIVLRISGGSKGDLKSGGHKDE